MVDAVVEGGLIRPLRPLQFPEGTRLRLRLSTSDTPAVTTTAPPRDEAPGPAAAPRNGAGQRDRGRAAALERFRPALVVSALGLALVSQTAFFQQLAFSWIGLGFGLAGAIVMAGALFAEGRETLPAPAARGPATFVTLTPWQLSVLVLVGFGSAWLLFALADSQPFPSKRWALPLWALLIALYGLATAPRPRLGRLTRPGWMSVVAALIFVVALGLRAWDVGNLPATLSGDEGRFGVETMRVLSGEISNPFSTGWLSVPTLTFFYNAPSVALLGNTVVALRLPWVLMGALNVLTVYWLATRLQGPVVGITTAVLLALYHYHIHYSRLGLNNIADPFFTALALLLLFRAYDRRSSADWVLCGVVTGVSQYFYFGARFIVMVVAASIACLALRNGRRFWREHGRGLLIGIGAALVTAAPIIQYAFRFPDVYNARINQTGIIQSGWLAREVVIRDENAAIILLDQLARAALAFNAYPDRTVWYGLRGPLLDFGSGALLILGLGYAAARVLNPHIFPMLVWLGGAIVLGGALTESPPASQRLITTAVPVSFFVALALVACARVGARLGPNPAWQRRIRYGLLGSATAAIGLVSLQTYFGSYTPQRIYGSFNGIISTSLGQYARDQLGQGWRVYFLGTPQMSYGFGANLYLAPQTEGVDVPVPETFADYRRVVQADKDAAFVVLPFRQAELSALQALYPGGTVDVIPSPLGEEALFFVYKVPRRQLAATTPRDPPVLPGDDHNLRTPYSSGMAQKSLPVGDDR